MNGATKGGTAFQITSGGTETILHAFGGGDPQSPIGGVIQGTNGFFYGAAQLGGTSGELSAGVRHRVPVFGDSSGGNTDTYADTHSHTGADTHSHADADTDTRSYPSADACSDAGSHPKASAHASPNAQTGRLARRQPEGERRTPG